MIYFVEKKVIRFEFHGKDGPKKASVSIEGISDIRFLKKSISAICVHATGKTNYTQCSYVNNFIRKLCAYLIHRNVNIPKAVVGWNKFIFEFMRFYLGNEFFCGSVRGKLVLWQFSIVPIFNLLRYQSIIPYEVIVPRINIKNEIYNFSLKKTLKNLRAESSVRDQVSKLLVSTSFSKNDEDFIAHIHRESRMKIDVIKYIFALHWRNFVSDNSVFNALVSEISNDQFKKIVNEDCSIKTVAPKGFSHRCSPIKESAVNWAFAIVKHLLSNEKNLECISLRRLRLLPYFKSNAFGTHDYKTTLEKKTAMPIYAFRRLSSANLLYRFAGLLSSVEISAVCALLIIEHPNFNPLSIANSKIFSKGGKSLFINTDSAEKIIFSVDKPRAGSRKSAVLSEFAAKLIHKVIELTNSVREILKARNDSDYEYLFLGVNLGGNLGRNTAKLTDSLTAEKGQSLCRLYPELEANGLARGTLSYRTIRNTMGFLRWFETGSIKEMSRILGNSEKVCIESYLPPEVLNAWNTRIIRRHQNTLIILASHNEKYLLDVTDFTTAKELADFTMQLLSDNEAGNNPLANEINLRLSGIEINSKNADSILNIRLCGKSLAYLYAFSEWSIKHNSKHLDDNSINLIELSIFIKHTCESSVISNNLSNIIDVNALKKIHSEALVLKKDLSELIDVIKPDGY